MSDADQFHSGVRSRLRLDMRQNDRTAHNPHGGGNTYELERARDEDMLLTSVGWANSYYQESGNYTDEWGIVWKQSEYTTRYGKGSYTEMVKHPLAEDAALETYRAPDPTRPELYCGAARTLQEFKHEYWIVGVTVTTIFECAWALRGLEQRLTDFALNPELAERILDIPCQYHLTAAKRLVEMGVDMIWTGDDVGAQHSMIISPACWRKYLKPRTATSECWRAGARGRQKQHGLDASGGAMQKRVHFQEHFAGGAEVPTQSQIVMGPSGRGGEPNSCRRGAARTIVCS